MPKIKILPIIIRIIFSREEFAEIVDCALDIVNKMNDDNNFDCNPTINFKNGDFILDVTVNECFDHGDACAKVKEAFKTAFPGLIFEL